MKLISPNTTAWKIIQVITRSTNSTSKEIYFKLKKNYGINITYQAVYKELQKLCAEEALIKEKLIYSLNYNWLEMRKNEVSQLLLNKNANRCILKKDNLEIHQFDNIKNLDNFIQQKVLELSKKLETKMTYWQSPHCWWLLGYPLEEDNTITKYAKLKLKTIAIITSNTFLDIKAKKYYDQKDPYSKTIIDTEKQSDEVIQIIGDHILISKLPEEVIQIMDTIYGQVNPSIKEIMALINHHDLFELQIIKNKHLAEAYVKNFS